MQKSECPSFHRSATVYTASKLNSNFPSYYDTWVKIAAKSSLGSLFPHHYPKKTSGIYYLKDWGSGFSEECNE